jgi:hypothetical protein
LPPRVARSRQELEENVMVTFDASFVSFTHDNGVYILGFSDGEFDYNDFVILQISDEITEEDILTHTDGEYLESSFFERRCLQRNIGNYH